MKWFTPFNKHINWQEIANNISYIVSQGYEHKVVIGTDSQPFKEGTVFIVAVCIFSEHPDFKQTYYYGKERQEAFLPFYKRLHHEVQLSLDVGNSLREHTSTTQRKLNIAIHLDLSAQEAKTKSGKYASGLINLVKAYDYPDVEVKPNSWAASCIADKYTKKRELARLESN